VRVLHDGYMAEGVQELGFQPGNLPAGNYFLHLRTSGRQQTTALIYKP